MRKQTTSTFTAAKRAATKASHDKKTTTRIPLSMQLSERPVRQHFQCWIVGDMPIICRAWSEKAKREMLQKQAKGTRRGRDERDPDTDFVNSLYEMPGGGYGFPVTGVKDCFCSMAHKERGVAKTTMKANLFLNFELISVRTAKAGARCDLPLVRLYGSKPIMREDMVKVGKGLNK